MFEYDRQIAAKKTASARKSCDNCGREFRYGYRGLGMATGGGWSAKGIIFWICRRYYHVCSDGCADAIEHWVNDEGVPKAHAEDQSNRAAG